MNHIIVKARRIGLTVQILSLVAAALLVYPTAYAEGVSCEVHEGNQPYQMSFNRFYEESWAPDAVMLVLKNEAGDIYQSAFLESLRKLTDDLFFLAGVNRKTVTSLFTPNVTYQPEGSAGLGKEPVAARPFQPTKRKLAQLKSNVEKAGIIGRLVSQDRTAAVVAAELLRVNPTTGDELDNRRLRHMLDRICVKYNGTGMRIEVLGLNNFPVEPVRAIEDPLPENFSLGTVPSGHWIQDMAICKQSWDEWDYGSQRLAAHIKRVKTELKPVEGKNYLAPKRAIAMFGYPVFAVQPGGFGLALGFTAILDAAHKDAADAVERWMGIELADCGNNECLGRKFSEHRNLVVMPLSSIYGHGKKTAIACIYRYQP